MTDMIAQEVVPAGKWSNAQDRCELTYEGRFLRRKVLTLASGATLLVDLEHTTSLDHGSALQTTDGRLIEILSAPEPLYAIAGSNLPRLAWHIGNRHTPCQIEQDRLLIQQDKVIGHMIEHVGGTVTEVVAPFNPEGGAYGHGRTHSHDHGATAHAH